MLVGVLIESDGYVESFCDYDGLSDLENGLELEVDPKWQLPEHLLSVV